MIINPPSRVDTDERRRERGGRPAMGLRISEIYQSIQGESTFAGLPCTFVRTVGCPLRCTWCDSAFSFHGGESMTIDAVLQRVLWLGCRLVEITGGEPLIQKNTLPLMAELCDMRHTVLIETSGHLDISVIDPRVHVIMDVKCPDSGEVERNRIENFELLRRDKDELKFVIASERDYAYARDLIEQHELSKRASVLLSPAYQLCDPKELVEWTLRDRVAARVQLQMHKYIWPPEARGV